MQRKDIEEQLDLLKAAINEKQPAENVVNILTKLKAEVVPTEDILRVCAPRCARIGVASERHLYTLSTLQGQTSVVSELIFL